MTSTEHASMEALRVFMSRQIERLTRTLMPERAMRLMEDLDGIPEWRGTLRPDEWNMVKR